MMNLDDATDAQLERVLTALRQAAWRMVDRINHPITPRTSHSRKWQAVTLLADYIRLTQSARTARLRGQINSAFIYEQRRNAIYSILPERLRW